MSINLEDYDVIRLLEIAVTNKNLQINRNIFNEGPPLSVTLTADGYLEIVARSHKKTSETVFFTSVQVKAPKKVNTMKFTMDINGQTIKFTAFDATPQRKVFMFKQKYRDLVSSVFVRYLCDLCYSNVFKVRVPELIKNLNIEESQFLVICNKETFFGPKETKSKDLDKFLHRVPILKAIIIEQEIKGRFPSESPFWHLDSLALKQGKSFELHQLFFFQGEQFVIYDSNFCYLDFAAIIDNWYYGGLSNLHSLKIHTVNHIYFDEQRFIYRYGAKKYDSTQRLACFTHGLQYESVSPDFFTNIDCTKGFDIEREDGRLATFLIREKTFQFFVWHTRF